MSKIFFKAINNLSYTRNMQHLFSIDRILTDSTEKIFQTGIIDCGMSDHQLIFCARKAKRAKFNKHNNVFLRSLKHYTVNVVLEELQKINFSNYERFFV